MNVYQTAMDIFRKRLQTENEDLLRDMAEAARLVQIPKGTVLFREGEVLRDCYCLVDGIVRIYYTMNGEEITESLRDDQGTILYPCVLINGVDDLANASIVSLSDCALLHIGVIPSNPSGSWVTIPGFCAAGRRNTRSIIWTTTASRSRRIS